MADEATFTIRFRDETISGGGGGGRPAVGGRGDGGAAATPGASVADDFQRSLGQGREQPAGTTTPLPMPPADHAPLPPSPGLPIPGIGQPAQPAPSQPVAPAVGSPAPVSPPVATTPPLTLPTVPPTGAAPMPPTPGVPLPPATSPPAATTPPSPPRTSTPPAVTPPVPPPIQTGQGPTPPPVQAPTAPTATVGQAIGMAQQAAQFLPGGLGRAFAGTAGAAAALPGVGAAALPASVAAALPAIGTALGVAGVGLAAAAIPAAGAAMFSEQVRAAREQVRDISPEVAAAEADAYVRRLVANFRTSDRLGDELSDSIRLSSRRDVALQGIRDVGIEQVLREANDINRVLIKLLEGLQWLAELNPDVTGTAVWTSLVVAANSMWPGLGTMADNIAKIGKLLEKEEEVEANMFNWFDRQPFLPLPAPFTEAGELAPTPVEFSVPMGLSL